MTENKRFTIKPQDDLFGITDNDTPDKINVINGIRTEIETKWLCDLMNELNDECEFLEIENKLLEDGATKYAELYHKSLKENEQLKQSNERLLKMLDNVANYMQKQNKYMPIDDFVEWWNGIATKGLDDGDGND